jgi:hypothetical protein
MDRVVPRTANRYCTTCLATRAFIDQVSFLVCPVCAKRLDRVLNAPQPWNTATGGVIQFTPQPPEV